MKHMIATLSNRSVSGSAFTLRPNSPLGNFIYPQNVIWNSEPLLEDKLIYVHI